MNIKVPQKILVIQTAFIGDVILATAVLEKLHLFFPNAKIDFLVRKGNESLFDLHPFLNQVLIWNKKGQKLLELFALTRNVRRSQYDVVVNLQRYASSGLITAFSGAAQTIGYAPNPFSMLFSTRISYRIVTKEVPGLHEVNRCLRTIEHLTDSSVVGPKLYPSDSDFKRVEDFKVKPYITISPASVWMTKRAPLELWNQLIERLNPERVFLLGGPSDFELCRQLQGLSINPNIEILCGKLTLLQSAALMRDAQMNYTNDSAPLHLCSALNAPVRAVFCSTIPEFGFGPFNSNGRAIEIKGALACRPCGNHGRANCPLGHFNCSKILVNDLIS